MRGAGVGRSDLDEGIFHLVCMGKGGPSWGSGGMNNRPTTSAGNWMEGEES